LKKEVEILKIGTILPDIKGGREFTIMVVYNGGPIFDHYVSILREKCGDEYKYLKTDKAIVGTPSVFRSSLLGSVKVTSLKGLSDGDPIVGQSYTINNSSWYTSKVDRIVDEDILITRNSVYVIHDISKLRDKKLQDLGF
jgi:hypothetical protein